MDDVVLTLDVDWAPEFAIDFVAHRLGQAGVSATWLVTDANPAIERLRARPELFELGIHPNFLPESSHGNDHSSVLQHCMRLVSDATCMRGHSFMLSSEILIEALLKTPIRSDLTVLLPRTPRLQPADFWWRGQRMVRFPTFWEDDVEFEAPSPMFRFSEILGVGPGLKVLNFHPLHIYLNSRNSEAYERLRQRVGHMRDADEEHASDLVSTGRGARSLFEEAIDALSSMSTRTVSAVARDWIEDRPVPPN